MEPGTLGFLVLAGFTAAFIDAMVGGGGAISIPALLVAGLPPHLALGTNKLAATGSSFTATVQYARAGTLEPGLAWFMAPFAGIGAVFGVEAVLALDPVLVEGLVIALMVAMTGYVVLKKEFGVESEFQAPGWRRLWLMTTLGMVIGAYDGFLGPGSGSLFLFALIGVLGFDFVQAAGHGRVLNFAANLAALAYFWVQGQVLVVEGLVMGAGMLAGAWLGARAGIKHGSAWIKPLFVVITLVMALRLTGVLGAVAAWLGLG